MRLLLALTLCASSACAKPVTDYLACMDKQTELLAWTSLEPASAEHAKQLFATADARCGTDRQGIAADINSFGAPGFSDGFYGAIYLHFTLRTYRLLAARKDML